MKKANFDNRTLQNPTATPSIQRCVCVLQVRPYVQVATETRNLNDVVVNEGRPEQTTAYRKTREMVK